MRNLLASTVIFLFFSSTVMACPACAVTNPQKDSWINFWILSAMGILPLVIALVIGWAIVQIGKCDKTRIS